MPLELAFEELNQLNQHCQREKADNPDERFRLELQALSKESDPINRMRKQGEIASHYRLSKVEIQEALKHIEQQIITPQKTSFSFDEFFAEGTEAIQWIVPQLLPKGETTLLAAQAKCGKTGLVTDIIYAVLTGGVVIGEQVGVKRRSCLSAQMKAATVPGGGCALEVLIY